MVVSMRYSEWSSGLFGFTQKEGGQMLDIEVHTVKPHMLKAVRRLRGSSFHGSPFPPGREGCLP